ncbi:MAG: hypothetical protein FWF83_07510 [Clostridiales bacterium]|nr:hypothetical protein [Clostridiales bacterium]
MSGPKVSHAELERRRQEELERQRQERLRRIRVETERLTREITKTKEDICRIEDDRALLIRQLGSEAEMAVTVEAWKALKKLYKGKLLDAMDSSVPTEPEEIAQYAQRMRLLREELSAAYAAEAKPLEERIEGYFAAVERHRELSAAFDALHVDEAIKTRTRIEDFDFGMMAQSVSRGDMEADMKEKALQILAEISGLVNTEAIEESDMELLLAVANNINKAAFETSRFFEAAAQEYYAAKNRAIRNIALFEDLYQDYYAEYVVYLETLNQGRVKPIPVTPKEKYQFASVRELEEEIAALAEISRHAREMAFIRDQIDKAMAEVGYGVSDEIVFYDNQAGSHYLCDNQADGTAIHIHISDTKQMMMEIVGTGETERTGPVSAATAVRLGAAELSSLDREAMYRAQTSFCDMHPAIVEALRKEGVLLDGFRRKPPSEDNSVRILHIRGEAAEREVAVSAVQYNAQAGERRRAVGQKAAYQEMRLGR